MTQRSFFGFVEKIARGLFQTVKGWCEELYARNAPCSPGKGRGQEIPKELKKKRESESEKREVDPKETGFLSETLLKDAENENLTETSAMEFPIYRGDEERQGNLISGEQSRPEKEKRLR